MSRSIVLSLRRKSKNEKVQKVRRSEKHFEELASKLARWSSDYMTVVEKSNPEMPEELYNRREDNWEPLITIADVAGGEWPRLARKAALLISGADQETVSLGVELLQDIREVFTEFGEDSLSSKILIGKLTEEGLKEWATYHKGNPMTELQLSKSLKGFGITPQKIRVGTSTPRGYKVEQFSDAWARYIPIGGGSNPEHPPLNTAHIPIPLAHTGTEDAGMNLWEGDPNAGGI